MAGQRPQSDHRFRAGDRARDAVYSRMVAAQRPWYSPPHGLGRSPNARSALRVLRALRCVAFSACLIWIGLAERVGAQASPSRWVLVYTGGPKRPAYTVHDFVDLIGTIDTADHVTGWLFDGAVFTEFQAVSGRYYMPWVNGTASTGADWLTYLDSLFAPGGALVRLDSAAGLVALATGEAQRHVGIAVMVPYPDPRSDTVRFGSGSFGMHSDSGRAGAVRAYLSEVARRFRERRLLHESLVAFYWLNEGITSADTGLVPRVGRDVHSLGAQFIWIPSYGAAGSDKWKSLGFAQAWLQPNYFFHPDVPVTRLDTALVRIRAASMGLEVEFDRRLFGSWQFAD